MEEIPQELIEALKFFCNHYGYGMATIQGPMFTALVFAPGELSPEQSSVLVAHALLDGIVTGQWCQENNDAILRKMKTNGRKM